MRILNLLTSACVYFCVATVIAQAVALGMLYAKGTLNENRLYSMLAALHGIQSEPAATAADEDVEGVAFEDIVAARVRGSLDHDLREMALDKGLGDLVNLEASLRVERTRYDDLKQEFDIHVAKLQEGVRNESLQKLQRILESVHPRQAKDQLLMMIRDDDALDDAVTIIKSMPVDKRKKILAEFKTADEPEELFRILREVRLGMPEVRQIQRTREQLDALKPTKQGPQP